MLINGRKFDFRIWVLVTQNMDVMLFKEGYIRTSSSTYTTAREALDNDFVHLTNNAVQAKLKDYGKFEKGNQLSFDRF